MRQKSGNCIFHFILTCTLCKQNQTKSFEKTDSIRLGADKLAVFDFSVIPALIFFVSALTLSRTTLNTSSS